jgi:uncharacterized HAD superfamily protein
MRTFFLTSVIAVQLICTAIGIQAQNQSAINPRMDVEHLQGNTMPEMGHAFGDNTRFKANQMQEGIESIENLKTGKGKQFRSELGDTQLLDSTIAETWDTLTNQWVNSSKEEIIYFGNKTFHDFYFWDADSSQWLSNNNIKEEFTYDVDGNILNFNFIYVRCNPAFCCCILHKDEYGYDTSGNITLESYYEWNESSNQWVGINKSEYTYAGNGEIASFNYFIWDRTTSKWVNIFKNECVYDNNGYQTSFCEYEWDTISNQWVGYSKYENTYDGSGKISIQYRYLWDKTTSNWSSLLRYIYEYDTKDSITVKTGYGYLWDKSTSQWVISYKEENTYDTNGNKTSYSYCTWDKATGKWVGYLNGHGFGPKEEWTYDSNGNIILYIFFGWDNGDTDWVRKGKEEYNYDENWNKTLEIYYAWDANTSQWLGWMKYERNFNSNGNKTLEIYYGWDANTSQWVVFSKNKQEYTYDSNGNMTLEIYYDWNAATSQWIANSKTTYYYSDHSITNIPKTPETHLTVYPNPAREFIVFDLTTTRESAVLTIYDIHGKKVIEQRLNESHQVSISHLTKGLYLYRLDDGMTIYTGKVIKE